MALNRRELTRQVIYTGVGARETPAPVLHLMTVLGRQLAQYGWLLRSGGSPGADTAFEQGCDEAHGRKEIFLPWSGFNGSESPLFAIPAEALTIAAKYHPGLRVSSHAVRKLRARNVCQILGYELDQPSHLVIAWTQGGAVTGGTSTVLHIAKDRDIPVMNLGSPELVGCDSDALIEQALSLVHGGGGG